MGEENYKRMGLVLWDVDPFRYMLHIKEFVLFFLLFSSILCLFSVLPYRTVLCVQ
jgi:hypothetical protein